MSLSLRRSGAWRGVGSLSLRVSGQWRPVTAMWQRVNGAWRQVFGSGATPPTGLTATGSKDYSTTVQHLDTHGPTFAIASAFNVSGGTAPYTFTPSGGAPNQKDIVNTGYNVHIDIYRDIAPGTYGASITGTFRDATGATASYTTNVTINVTS